MSVRLLSRREGTRRHSLLLKPLTTLAGHARSGGVKLFSLVIGAWVSVLAVDTLASNTNNATVTAAVRNDLGQLKWVVTAPTDYTPLQREGRRLFLESGCTYCHSKYSLPVESETRPWGVVSTDPRRWGPAVEPGEYAFDKPLAFGTKGIAPDLARVGLKYGDGWHLAHFWRPPLITQGSIMGGFSGLFDNVAEPVERVDDDGASTLERTATTERLFDFSSDQQVKLTPNAEGVLFVPLSAQGKYPEIWTPNDEYTGDTLELVAESEAIAALTAYMQKLGTNRGLWRDAFEPGEVEGADIDMPRSQEAIERGKTVYERHCVACHGIKGDGNGPAATFTHVQRPRDFTFGVFKYRSTQDPLPTDADLLRTITRGVRGTAMPAWFELPLQDRLAVIQYIKYELAADRMDPDEPYFYFVEEPPGEPLEIGTPPESSAELVAHGAEIWRQAKCWECHGDAGKGDGEKAAGLEDDLGFPIVPANLTRGLFKSGPTVSDIYRTISTGLSGTPMPSFKDAFSDEDRWALAYYVLSLSAFTSPLTGEPLPIPETARQALNKPDLEAPTPEQAYRPEQFLAAGEGP